MSSKSSDYEDLKNVGHTAPMSSTKHREVAKLDRVPLFTEAARIGTTGWHVTRAGRPSRSEPVR